MITVVCLRDSLIDNPRFQYIISCRRDNGELVRIMFDGIIPPRKFVDLFNRSKIMPSNHYEVMIHAHSTWVRSCNEKMMDPTTSDYDVQRLTLEKS